MKNNTVIVLCGPTASGKTDLSIKLCSRFNAEVVGCDAVQIYRYLDIGSAKPSPEIRKKIPHHLIDFLDPAQSFSAADYRRAAVDAINSILNRGKIPIVVGGSGFYLRALTGGLSPIPKIPEEIRNNIRALINKEGTAKAYKRLKQLDPSAASVVRPGDSYRISRALEVFTATGKSITHFWNAPPEKENSFIYTKIGLKTDRRVLYENIDKRCEYMFKNGILDEVARLLQRGYSPTIKPLQSVGYRQALDVVLNGRDREEALVEAKTKTRNLAKRQITWFKADREIKWFEPEDIEKITEFIEENLK